MRPTFRQLQYIVSVADTGRFGLAAQHMNVSQPSLSTQIAEAEAELGLVIFSRGRSGAIPTPGGQDVIRRARIILGELEDLRATASGNSIFDGRLRLGILPTIGPYLLPNVVRILHRKHPNFRLVVREESTRDLEEGLRLGRLDMAISTFDDHLTDHKEYLFDEELWLGLALDDPLAADSTPIKPKDIGARNFLTIGMRHRLFHIVSGLASRAGGTVSDEYEGTSLDAIRLMAAAGVGIAVLPQIYALTEAQRGTDIVLRKIQSPDAVRKMALVQPKGRDPLPGSTDLADILRKEAARIIEKESKRAS